MPFKIEPIGHGRALTCYIYLRQRADEWEESSSDELSDTDDDESDESECSDSEDEPFQAGSGDSRYLREEKRVIDQVTQPEDWEDDTQACTKIRRLDLDEQHEVQMVK